MNIIIFILGLLIGSFLNVCIYRVPRGESVVHPPSHCTSCNTRLGALDLIPVLSYLILRGRCRHCKKPYSARYMGIEILNAVFYLSIFLKYGYSLNTITYMMISSILIISTFVDLEHMIIPDGFIITGLVGTIIMFVVERNLQNVIDGALGFLVGGGIFFIIAVVSNGAMGGGDIKLMALLGLVFKVKNILIISLLSFVIGAIISVVLMAFKIKSRKDYIPFGPFIAASAMLVMLYGEEIINLYLKIFLS